MVVEILDLLVTLDLSPSDAKLHIGQRISSIRPCLPPHREHPSMSELVLSGLHGRRPASSSLVFFFPTQFIAS